jgi:hypothetical protein
VSFSSTIEHHFILTFLFINCFADGSQERTGILHITLKRSKSQRVKKNVSSKAVLFENIFQAEPAANEKQQHIVFGQFVAVFPVQLGQFFMEDMFSRGEHPGRAQVDGLVRLKIFLNDIIGEFEETFIGGDNEIRIPVKADGGDKGSIVLHRWEKGNGKDVIADYFRDDAHGFFVADIGVVVFIAFKGQAVAFKPIKF